MPRKRDLGLLINCRCSVGIACEEHIQRPVLSLVVPEWREFNQRSELDGFNSCWRKKGSGVEEHVARKIGTGDESVLRSQLDDGPKNPFLGSRETGRQPGPHLNCEGGHCVHQVPPRRKWAKAGIAGEVLEGARSGSAP